MSGGPGRPGVRQDVRHPGNSGPAAERQGQGPAQETTGGSIAERDIPDREQQRHPGAVPAEESGAPPARRLIGLSETKTGPTGRLRPSASAASEAAAPSLDHRTGEDPAETVDSQLEQPL